MINIIAACDKNRGIGFNNELLVKLPSDMKHFKELTLMQYCVFGRKTFESLPKPLPNRYNIVLSRNAKYETPPGVYQYQTLEDVIFEYKSHNNNQNELFVCGGSQVYKQALEYAERIYLTVIDHEFEQADTFFPQFDLDEWKITDKITNKADNENPYDHYFLIYERRSNKK